MRTPQNSERFIGITLEISWTISPEHSRKQIMSIRLVTSILLAAILAGSLSEASLDRYGEFGSQYDGFDKRCVAKFIMDEVKYQVEGEPVADILKADSRAIRESVLQSSDGFNSLARCSPNCLLKHCKKPAQQIKTPSTRLDFRRCVKFTQIDSLCELSAERKFEQPHLVPFEKWACEYREAIKMDPDEYARKCEVAALRLGRIEAEEVLSATLRMSSISIESIKGAIMAEIKADEEPKRMQDEENTSTILDWVARTIETTLPGYVSCIENREETKPTKKRSVMGKLKKIIPCKGKCSIDDVK